MRTKEEILNEFFATKYPHMAIYQNSAMIYGDGIEVLGILENQYLRYLSSIQQLIDIGPLDLELLKAIQSKIKAITIPEPLEEKDFLKLMSEQRASVFQAKIESLKSVRLQTATAVLSGMMAGDRDSPTKMAQEAVDYADALIEHLNTAKP